MDRPKLVAGAVALFVVFLFFTSGSSMSSSSTSHLFRGGALSTAALNTGVWGRTNSVEMMEFAVVADLDQTSRITSQDGTCDKDQWTSVLKMGRLIRAPEGNYEIVWGEEKTLTTKLGESGRGLELSELVNWQGELFTFDDRSGIAFQVTQDFKCLPKYIFTDGDGTSTKGQKTEWATVKDGKLYVGSMGKEFVKDGKVTSRNQLWVNVVHENGMIEHENWTTRFDLLREATGTTYPGYMVHEAIHFDQVHREWYVLPRRVSADAYDEKLDELKGSNIALVLDENFSRVKRKFTIGPLVPLRGWSSFKFVPFTNNQVIIALKTEEEENKENAKETSQRTYITVFDTDGKELMPQTLFSADKKFEGIEFI